jgi:transcriptional regulator with XRE-family HTH domain
MNLRSTLAAEFARRRRLNPRYSLRAFALALGTHHSTVSRILQGRRRLTERAIRQFAGPLGLTPKQLADVCLAENCSAIIRLVRQPRFRPDARWIAVMAGIPLDGVSIAIHRLLAERRLAMRSPTRWTAGDS